MEQISQFTTAPIHRSTYRCIYKEHRYSVDDKVVIVWLSPMSKMLTKGKGRRNVPSNSADVSIVVVKPHQPMNCCTTPSRRSNKKKTHKQEMKPVVYKRAQ